MELNQFYLVFQPIVKTRNNKKLFGEICEYEILLRSSKEDLFPENEFSIILSNEQKYNAYMMWLTSKLEKKLLKNPGINFSVNLDIDQFHYQ